jgi:C4-dicarboxylate-specific signal transduction histidine kinase
MIWNRVSAEKKAFEMELRLRRKDGEYRRFFIQGAPFLADAGELMQWFGTNTDIEDRHQAEGALRKAQAELTHVTRVTTVGELAASIAHEVNQPLGAIVNNGTVCLRHLAESAHDCPTEVQEALTDIVSDANRASAIIARVRAMTKRSAPENESLQLKEIVADNLALASRELSERRIAVRTELAEDLPRITGDRVELQQVLLNLVMNAIEAMGAVESERRSLTIRGQRDELNGEPAALMAVHDLGIGVEPGHMARLFDAFYTTKPQGMGMGLRISRSIVEARGGRLWAEPNAGPGMTFFCSLPAEKPSA